MRIGAGCTRSPLLVILSSMQLRIFLTALLVVLGALFFYTDAVNIGSYMPFFDGETALAPPNGGEEESAFTAPVIPFRETPQAVETAPKGEVQLSGPLLVSKQEVAESTLTKEGIFFWTNVERGKEGVRLLGTDAALDAVAKAKLIDLFDKQYFAHVSPDGKDVGDLAKEFGYEYIKVGENLALGNFESDFELVVNGWMQSAGHRANILNEDYEEIGVAVAEGVFEGRVTWIAVQVFGTSIDACPAVDDELKDAIDARNARLGVIADELDQMAEDIEKTVPKSGPEYRAKIDAYNAKVNEYNTLLEELKQWVAIYNNQVRAFNACVEAL